MINWENENKHKIKIEFGKLDDGESFKLPQLNDVIFIKTDNGLCTPINKNKSKYLPGMVIDLYVDQIVIPTEFLIKEK